MRQERALPTPVTITDEYLAGIYDRLGQVLDRLRPPDPSPGTGTVELREPATPEPADISEPEVKPARARRPRQARG